MARSHTLRLGAVALWAMCLVAAAADPSGGPGDRLPDRPSPVAVASMSTEPEAAMLPPRTADELRVSTSGTPLRVLVLAAVLALLVALPPVRRQTSTLTGRDEHPLRSHRYAISLRAPPLRLA